MTFEQWYQLMVDAHWEPTVTQAGIFDGDDMPAWEHSNGHKLIAEQAEKYFLDGVVPTPF